MTLTPEIAALYERPARQPFRIDADHAHQLSAMSPAERTMALQDAYNAHLIEQARIQAGALTAGSWSPFAKAIARSWDQRGAEYMAAAEAEYERALAAAQVTTLAAALAWRSVAADQAEAA